jgi:RimJ/RimL family protein N-acetyltransferase
MAEKTKIYLETERMFLRELTVQDEAIILELDSDPEVMKYLTNGVSSSVEDIRGALQRTEDMFRQHQGKFGFWAAHDRTSGEFFGWFHFRPAKDDPENVKRIELGYRFRKKFWGQGLATEGSRALIKKGFSELGVEEVFAVTMEGNRGSRNVMEKVGMKFVRSFHDPAYPDSLEKEVEYSLTKDT